MNSPTTTPIGHRSKQGDSQGISEPSTPQDHKGKVRLRNHLIGGEAGMATAEYTNVDSS